MNARTVSLVVVAAACALSSPGAPKSGEANGGALRVANAVTGPYLVSVWTSPTPPRVGRLDVSVAVMAPESGEAVLDAAARVTATAASGTVRHAAATRGGGGNLLLYHADIEVGAPGTLAITVDVRGPRGAGTVGFTLEALAARPVPWAWLTLVGVLLLIAYVVWRRPRRGAGRRATA